MLAPLLLCALPFQGSLFHSATYVSPSGRRELVVEPAVFSGGAREATYRMTLDRLELWSVKLPLLMRDAVLADDGRTAGYCYAVDAKGESAELLVFVLSPEGQVVARVPNTLRNTGYQHGEAVFLPRVERLVLQPELGRFVLAMFDDDHGFHTALWPYDLSSGAALTPQPIQVGREQLVSVLDLRSIPSTPLLLAAWARSDYGVKPTRRDASFQLLDADGHAVWTFELAHDYELGGDWIAELNLEDHLRERSPILGVFPGRFELHARAEAQRILFQVERVDEAWRVTELSRLFYSDWDAPPTTFQPALIERVPLRSTIAADEKPGLANLDAAHGRILMKDEHATVHVLDLQGRELARYALEAEESRAPDDPRWPQPETLGVTHDGGFDAGLGRHHARFGADGTRQGVVELDARRALLRPEADGFWMIRGDALVRSDASGTVELRHDKRPDGKWFTNVQAFALAHDGALAVLDGSPRPGRKLKDAALTFYEPDGTTGLVIRVRDGIPRESLAYQNQRVLFIGEAELEILDVVGGRRLGLEVDEAKHREYDEYALSPDGHELWVLRRTQREFVRYALPE